MSGLKYQAFASAALAVLAAPALAQEAPQTPQTSPPQPQPAAGQSGVISYTPADFADARPNTALDMISRLPGFTFEGGDQVRGFAGAAGNVLIDGARPTIKTDSLSDTLGRIPITQVERIDVIRGGAPGIDMQGKAVIANVIRKRVDTFQQVLEGRSFIFAKTGHTIPGWNYQATKRSGEHQFDFSLSRGTSYDDSVGFGFRRTTDYPSMTETLENAFSEADGWVYSGRAGYKGPQFGGTFSANALIATDEFKDEGHFYTPDSDQRFTGRSANDRGEIGLNYTKDLNDKFEIEALALSKIAFGTGHSGAVVYPPGIPTPETANFNVDAEAGESIGRGVLRYTLSPRLSFEGGGEVAFNYREQSVALSQNGIAVALPASDVRVEELRGETFAQGAWRPSDKWSLEAGVRVERSTITQSGQIEKERSFTYPKPRLLVTWSPTKEEQVRLRVEREVGQLNFQDFASEVSLNSGVLTAGNSDLRPDKTWAYEIAFEKRFWENGAIVLTLRHEEITDVIDVFPFTVTVDDNNDGVPDDLNPADGVPDTVLVSGPGNIGDGKNDVIALNATLPLERFGLKGAELKADVTLQESEVRDPTTGVMRRISGQRPDNVNLSFRHDLPELKLTYGVNFYAGWRERHYLPEEIQLLDLRSFWGSFIEYKPTSNFTLRGEINNFVPYQFDITRRVYDGSRATTQLDFIENEHRDSQVIIELSARWTLG
ncbi:MAG TPA: TonB-dependent receptor [Hyphomonadaceae bacterium]|nr:TonB-dependent receptor [Hyphomonadaceae bacterium]